MERMTTWGSTNYTIYGSSTGRVSSTSSHHGTIFWTYTGAIYEKPFDVNCPVCKADPGQRCARTVFNKKKWREERKRKKDWYRFNPMTPPQQRQELLPHSERWKESKLKTVNERLDR